MFFHTYLYFLYFFRLSYFTRDKCGKLALSPKQKAIFSRWVRPDEISNNPTMIMSVSSFSIKQVRLNMFLMVYCLLGTPFQGHILNMGIKRRP